MKRQGQEHHAGAGKTGAGAPGRSRKDRGRSTTQEQERQEQGHLAGAGKTRAAAPRRSRTQEHGQKRIDNFEKIGNRCRQKGANNSPFLFLLLPGGPAWWIRGQ